MKSEHVEDVCSMDNFFMHAPRGVFQFLVHSGINQKIFSVQILCYSALTFQLSISQDGGKAADTGKQRKQELLSV